MSKKVKHPEIEVALTGESGNAFAILGEVRRAMKKAKLPKEEQDQFMKEATSGNYDHLLETCMNWFTIN